MQQDCYKILQVDPKAEPEVIEGAYRRLARKYHPDVNKHPDAAQRMKEINLAYEVLSDPQKRAAYDRSRAACSASPRASSSARSAPRQEARPGPILKITPAALDFGSLDVEERKTLTLYLTNSGRGTLSITIRRSQPWLKTDIAKVRANLTVVQVTVEAKELAAGQVHHASIEVTSTGGKAWIPVTVQVASLSELKVTPARLGPESLVQLWQRLHPWASIIALIAVVVMLFSRGEVRIDLALPTTVTISPTVTSKPTPTPGLKPKVYIVQPGDTLWKIAERHDVTVDKIMEANDIADRSLIIVGQEFIIPATGSTDSMKWGLIALAVVATLVVGFFLRNKVESYRHSKKASVFSIAGKQLGLDRAPEGRSLTIWFQSGDQKVKQLIIKW